MATLGTIRESNCQTSDGQRINGVGVVFSLEPFNVTKPFIPMKHLPLTGDIETKIGSPPDQKKSHTNRPST